MLVWEDAFLCEKIRVRERESERAKAGESDKVNQPKSEVKWNEEMLHGM